MSQDSRQCSGPGSLYPVTSNLLLSADTCIVGLFKNFDFANVFLPFIKI